MFSRLPGMRNRQMNSVLVFSVVFPHTRQRIHSRSWHRRWTLLGCIFTLQLFVDSLSRRESPGSIQSVQCLFWFEFTNHAELLERSEHKCNSEQHAIWGNTSINPYRKDESSEGHCFEVVRGKKNLLTLLWQLWSFSLSLKPLFRTQIDNRFVLLDQTALEKTSYWKHPLPTIIRVP